VERHCLVSHTVNLVQGKYEDSEFNNYAQISEASGSIIGDQQQRPDFSMLPSANVESKLAKLPNNDQIMEEQNESDGDEE
jgi:hypothetical protein